MNYLFQLLKYSNENGLPIPLAADSAKPGKPPSVTLFFLYITNILAIISLINLHIKGDPLTSSIITCIYSITWVVLYMMRNLHKAKVDLDDKSIEFEGDNNETSN